MNISTLELSQAFLHGLNSIRRYLVLTVPGIIIIIGSVYVAEMWTEGQISPLYLLFIAGIVILVGFIYVLKVLIKHQMPSKPRYRLLHRVH